MMRWMVCFGVAVILQFLMHSAADARAPELDPLQGKWNVVELVIDGAVIPQDQIQYKLPSGGKIEIIDNAFIFKSPLDGRQHARTFTVDATRYPKQIDLVDSDSNPIQGIYDLKGGRLLLCVSDAAKPGIPSEFAAAAGTGRMLMVMERPEAVAKVSSEKPTTAAVPVQSPRVPTLPSPPATNPPAAAPVGQAIPARPAPTPLRVIDDTELAAKLVGSWRHVDGEGVLFVNLNANGSFTTQRQFQNTQQFNRVFTNTYVSVGNWHVSNGALIMQVKSSWRPERINQIIRVQVRSITTKEVVYVDQLGRASRDVRVQ